MSDMIRQTDRYLDDELSDEELAELFQWVGANAANADQFARQTMIDQHTSELLGGGDLLSTTRLSNTDQQASPIQAKPWRAHLRSPRRIAWVAAFATTALLLIALFPLSDAPKPTRPADAIAEITYASNAFVADRVCSVGDFVGRGLLELKTGLVRLDFANGAAITLQGPARFEIFNGDSARLSSGILTASIPDAAIGFEVNTPAMKVVDLGTAFGVSVGADGETGVCVFEGEVEVSRSATNDVPKRVREGNAVRCRPEADSIDSVDYTTERYEDGWPVTSGVLQATGLMKFVSPGPDFVPGRYEDSSRIMVFRERFGLTLDVDLAVDLVEPGQYLRIHRRAQEVVSAGQRVSSYLLQLDPIGELQRHTPNKPRVIGQITFDQPVLGLIAVSQRLLATDELLGNPLGNYSKMPRGIEPLRTSDTANNGRDVVILSEDRRTLSLDLSAGSAVDQIRVIVDASPK